MTELLDRCRKNTSVVYCDPHERIVVSLPIAWEPSDRWSSVDLHIIQLANMFFTYDKNRKELICRKNRWDGNTEITNRVFYQTEQILQNPHTEETMLKVLKGRLLRTELLK